MNGIHHLFLLLVVKEIQSDDIPGHSPNTFNQENYAANQVFHRNVTMHNVTKDCGDLQEIMNIETRCKFNLQQLVIQGFPWHVPYKQVSGQHETNYYRNVRDSMDSLDHVCHILDETEQCFKEHSIRDYCLNAAHSFFLKMDFEFICHQRQRDENLVRSLQCLLDKRVLVMLFFRVLRDCSGGVNILDDLMVRMANIYFYSLNVNPYRDMPFFFHFYCLPKTVISSCIGQIVEAQCGAMSSDLVQKYLMYLQDQVGQGLERVGLPSTICDQNIYADTPPISSNHHKPTLFEQFYSVPQGTAMDTIFGRVLAAILQKHSIEENPCNYPIPYASYLTCVMSSDDKYEKSRFSILQFAHQMIDFFYHGTQCNRLGYFSSCWNLLQEICGPKVRGFAQHATLMVEGCKVQSEMDAAGCPWQDMLVTHYIQAGRVTPWPFTLQGLGNPLFLESSVNSKSSILNDLEKFISHLEPGVEEISRKCGERPAKRLRLLFQKLRLLQLDAFLYAAEHGSR